MRPHLTTDYLKNLFVPAGSAFVVFLFWIIFQYVFKLDFACPCDPEENTHVCVVYMTCPAASLFIVVMITDKHIRTIFCCNGTRIQCKSVILITSLIKALSVANLWIFTVLMDGDWFACLTTTNYTLPPYEQTFCKPSKTPAEDSDIRVKKSLSREYAISVLFAVSIIWLLWTAIRQSCCTHPLIYKYNKYFLEETDLYITKKLKKLAEDNAERGGQGLIETFQQQHTATIQQNIPGTQRPQRERVQLRSLPSTLQAASDQANPEQLDRSLDTCSISSEHLEDTADNLPLLQ